MSTATELLNQILRITGSKQITVSTERGSQKFDVAADGVIGYAPVHKLQLLRLLEEGCRQHGSVVVRQFIPDSEELVTLPDGKVISMPWKAIYGVFLAKGEYHGLTAEDVERASNTDARTNQKLPPEKLTIYRDFNDLTPGIPATNWLWTDNKR